ARLGERELDLVELRRPCLLVAHLHVLGAVLEVEELVANPAEHLHGHAGPDLALAVAARELPVDQLERVGRTEYRLLTGEALGIGVRDVVGRRVDRLLLGEETAKRRLKSEEG